MLSARSPKYPGLHDEESGVHFTSSRPVEVSEDQALALANRRFVDGILIGEFDDEGRAVKEQPAKEWARDIRRRSETENEPGGSGAEKTTTEPSTEARKTNRSK
jgi:hypothetical protein